MLEAPLFTAAGARAKSGFALPEEYFDGTVHEPVLHQAVRAYLANQRQGTASTKTRSVVSGGNQKPWRQKGTGRARQGSIRAPHWRGGGIVFGPHPRDYRSGIPIKVRRLARRSALNARAREGALYVIEPLAFDAPKTRQLVELLAKLGLAGRKALFLTDGVKRNLYLSGRNLSATQVLPYPDASAYDVLWSEVVIVERSALGGAVDAVPDGTEVVETRKPAKRTRTVKATRTVKTAKAKAKKPAARKATPAKKAAKKKKGRE
ncbi:MAG: 50S ribosomal protein L4 [Gemmatimonadales bacterium]